MNAVSYLRCSGESQIQGDTWDRQQFAIAKYAGSNDVEIVAEFRDEGVTGKMELENRNGLSACIAYVQENGIKLVIVEDQTRLARDLIVAEICIREFQKLGVRVIAASGGIDLTEGDDSNPTAKLIRQILAAVSEFERCCIVLKLRGARQRKKASEGRCEGVKPFGSLPGEECLLDAIHQMRVKGLTADAMAQCFNVNGHYGRSGKPWRASTIRKILARESKCSQ
jgi:DNA invertase Pin-like site-specific DNA recombinase